MKNYYIMFFYLVIIVDKTSLIHSGCDNSVLDITVKYKDIVCGEESLSQIPLKFEYLFSI